MEVHIASNFVIAGLYNEGIEIDEASTIRSLLGTISRLSAQRLVFFERGRNTIDCEGWEVDLNGISYEAHPEGLDTHLNEGDVVAIRLRPLCGG
jgi:molybdopterin converting factor small subunit